VNHPHGIHCIHTLGWDIRHWCRKCRNHWEAKCGKVRCRKYEAAAAEHLVRGVLLDMESGTLPLDPMMLSIDLSELTIDRPHFTEPSAN
jgi:hypothetical protein